MYRNEKWEGRWLWIQTTPDGPWYRAQPNEVIEALIERITNLEELFGHKS